MGISKWNAGIIRPVPVAPTGPYESGSAPGVWTVDQQAYWQKQGLWPTAGNVINYIEDVFSTYLYTGNGSTQTITNNIDLAGDGGLVWLKSRSQGSTNYTGNNLLYGSAIGYERMYSNSDTAAGSGNVISVSSTGFTTEGLAASGYNGDNFVSWTFREQPKFFDVVTYTGTGSTQAIPHNLGSVPGMYICKSASSTGDWNVYHRGLSGANKYLVLNSTAAETTLGSIWDSQAPTATQFYVGNNNAANTNGVTYVAYLFAHNAGGFGLTGTDNVISCGSYTGNGLLAGPVVTLGYEPQWVLVKRTDSTGNWILQDNMRSLSQTNTDMLFPNLSNAATTGAYPSVVPTATGFYIGDNGSNYNASGGTYVYIAIRRGPMAVPTLGTSVFQPITASSSSFITTTTATFPLDMQFNTFTNSSSATYNSQINDRLRGIGFAPSFSTTPHLTTASTAAESTSSTYLAFQGNGMDVTKDDGWGAATAVFYNFRRAPGFFDEVCYTGTSAARTVTHNLTVVPELMIVKDRSAVNNWVVYSAATGNTKALILNSTAAVGSPDIGDWNNTTPTASVFSLGGNGRVNTASATYVAYLFATCAGVSKVGSYTGTGALQTVACGFTSGARFVLVKRTDSTGDWYVWDSARGITAGDDPYLLLNSTAAEVTNTNYVDTDTTGFKVTAAAPAGINANGGTYIFLAIA